MTTLDQILNALKESGCFVGDIDDAIDEVKAKDERIKELEEVIKPKTCDTCTYFDNELWGGDCLNFGFRCTSAGAEAHRPDDGFCCNRYKPKDF